MVSRIPGIPKPDSGFRSEMALTTHRYLRRSVGPFVDGELPQFVAGAVSSHVDDCDECGDQAKLLIRLKEVLKRLAIDGAVAYADAPTTTNNSGTGF